MRQKSLLFFALLLLPLAWARGQNLVSNGDFSQYTTGCQSAFAFQGGCVNDWAMFSGSPSHDPAPGTAAWMWSGGSRGHFEAITQRVDFKSGHCYRVSFKVKTNDRGIANIRNNATINVRAVNLNGASAIASQAVIFSNTISPYLGNAYRTVTTTFRPASNFTNLLINPYYAGPEKQVEMYIVVP